jgi:phage terminase small subunit
MNARQQQFVIEYLKCGNGAEAYRRAGYSAPNVRTAGNGAERLLGDVGIKAEIERLRNEQKARGILQADEVLTEYKWLTQSDVGDIIDFSGPEPKMKPANEIPLRARRCISSVKVKRYVEGKGEDAKSVEIIEFKLWSKPDALEKAGRHLGLLKDSEANHAGATFNLVQIIEVVRPVIMESAPQPELPAIEVVRPETTNGAAAH